MLKKGEMLKKNERFCRTKKYKNGIIKELE